MALASVTTDGITIESNTQSEAVLRDELAQSTPAKAETTTADSKGVETDTEKPEVSAESQAGQQLAKKKRSLQDRIDEITAEKYASQRERDAAKAEADALKRELTALKAPKPQEQPKPPTEKFPRYDEYLQGHPDASLEDWMDARDTWRDGQREKQIREVQAKHAQERDRAQRAGQLAERWTKDAEADPALAEGLDTRLTDAWPISLLSPDQKPTFWNAVAEGILRAPNPLKLTRYLTDHEPELRRLATVPPDDFFWEMASLATRIGAASSTGPASKPQPKTSTAPPPIKPVSGSSPVAETEEPGDDASDDEWYRWQQSRKGRRRA
jgi:hypothetical protein